MSVFFLGTNLRTSSVSPEITASSTIDEVSMLSGVFSVSRTYFSWATFLRIRPWLRSRARFRVRSFHFMPVLRCTPGIPLARRAALALPPERGRTVGCFSEPRAPDLGLGRERLNIVFKINGYEVI